MKQTTTPAIKYIDGQPFVRVIDLGHQWHTNSSNILAIGKRHHVPEEQLRRIDGRVWCSFQGLRYRVAATKHGSSIAGRIREFLDSQEEKPTAAKPTTEPTPTDLGTVALIADARRTASQALNRAHEAGNFAYDANTLAKANDKRIGKLEIRMDSVKADVYSLKHRPRRDHVARHQSASATVINEKNEGRINDLDVRVQAVECDVPQLLDAVDHIDKKNAARLDKLDDRMAAIENDSYRRFDTFMTRCHHLETRQGDAAVQVTRVENRQRFTFWSLAAMATLQALAAIVRLARR